MPLFLLSVQMPLALLVEQIPCFLLVVQIPWFLLVEQMPHVPADQSLRILADQILRDPAALT